jgi:hypothetical protein
MNIKRILLILAFIVVTLGIGYALYYFFFRAPSAVPKKISNVNVSVSGLPTALPGAPKVAVNVNVGLPPVPSVSPVANGGVTAVTPVAPVPTVGASISATGQMNYYDSVDGKFYRIGANGVPVALSNNTFFNVSNATFSPQGNQAIIEYPDGSKIMFDFSKNQQVTLPSQWEDFGFSPNGSQIVAKSLGVDPNTHFLITANPDGSNAQPFQELGDNQDQVQVAWSPNNDILATSTTGPPLGADRQTVYFLGQYGQNFKSMAVEGLNFQPQWDPNGQQMVYSVAGSGSDFKPDLWVVDAQGDSIGADRHNLNVNTWANKCTFSDPQTMYCAVPDDLPEGAGLQPDIANSTPDTIYKIDVSTGAQTKVAIPEGTHTISKIMITPDQKTMYFTDQGTGVLNKISL